MKTIKSKRIEELSDYNQSRIKGAIALIEQGTTSSCYWGARSLILALESDISGEEYGSAPIHDNLASKYNYE